MPPLRLAEQQQRELVGEHFVIGEPAPRLVPARILVRERQRCPPPAPLLALGQARLDPFGEVGRPFERFARELAEAAAGEPLGQRVDRLADRRRGPLPGFGNLGMFALVEMVLFIVTVFIAYAYVWRRGGLEWD